MIDVKTIDDNTFEVTVKDRSTTTHRVSLSDDYYKKLANETTPKEDLIKRSFEFLLEHESNTMILSEFDLPVIERYFPSYPSEIKKRI